MIQGAVHRSPSISLTADENPGKPQLGDRLMKGLCDILFQLECKCRINNLLLVAL